MPLYSYTISLRVFHPSIDPEEISQTLSLPPARMWKVGTPRQTPKGMPLEGVYRETYWYTKLVPEGERSSSDTWLEDFLCEVSQQLLPHRAFFAPVRAEKGRVELFIGMYGDRNYGFELSPQLLTSFGGLGVSLGFAVYPGA